MEKSDGFDHLSATPVIQVGWWVVVTLEDGTAPMRAYVGKVAKINPCGLTITLVGLNNLDLWVPWSRILSILIDTTEDMARDFMSAAAVWQRQMCEGDR